MYIHEAVEKALNSKSGLKRTAWKTQLADVVVIPVCEVMPLDIDMLGKSQCRAHNWNPTPEDLMADDWEVTKV